MVYVNIDSLYLKCFEISNICIYINPKHYEKSYAIPKLFENIIL